MLLGVERRFSLSCGKLFALYVAAYTLGRGAVEVLRVDHANHFLGLRLNDWTSLIVFLGASSVLLWSRRAPVEHSETASGRPAAADPPTAEKRRRRD